MKVYNDNKTNKMTIELSEVLKKIRNEKSFNPKEYLRYKSFVLNQYMRTHKINTVIIGISGGIDSAVCLGILKYAKKKKIIKNIMPICFPAIESEGGVSNQIEATEKGKIVISHFNETPRIIDLSGPLASSVKEVFLKTKLKNSKWSIGQLVPNLRTSLSYFLTSLVSDAGDRAVVIGTINRDEGSYLGYMGKAGDALVDIQLISDLHKSEVYSLARYLNIPEKIINSIPTGDMFDGRTDEEVFGTSYDFVELYLNYLRDKSIIQGINKQSKERFEHLSLKLENLHKHNAHKYISSSSAVHLDLFDTKIVGGLKNNSTYRVEENLNPNKIVNFQKIDEASAIKVFSKNSKLTDKEIKFFLSNIKKWEKAGSDGYVGTKGSGSFRATFYSNVVSKLLGKKIKAPCFVIKNKVLYRYVGVSPSLRVIKYKEGGELLPHYDFPYNSSPEKTTLFSVVISLKEAIEGGETRFIKEERVNHNYSDWTDCKESELKILEEHKLKKGEILLFPHNRMHDSKKISKGEKIILRTDLVYEKV